MKKNKNKVEKQNKREEVKSRENSLRAGKTDKKLLAQNAS